jgi:hypothetical protein
LTKRSEKAPPSLALVLPLDFSTKKGAYKVWKNDLYDKKWVIYAKRPFGEPQQVIEYLGRYTHNLSRFFFGKIAISNHRLKAVGTEGGKTFSK